MASWAWTPPGSSRKYRQLARVFFPQETLPNNKCFCHRMVKICKHQHKGRGCTQEKSQGTASSREDVQ